MNYSQVIMNIFNEVWHEHTSIVISYLKEYLTIPDNNSINEHVSLSNFTEEWQTILTDLVNF